MADDFPEDSFFRNSNVAAFEAAIHEKDNNPSSQSNTETDLKCTQSTASFITAKQLLISRGGDSSVTAFSNPVATFKNAGNSEESSTLSSSRISIKNSKCKASNSSKNQSKSQNSRRCGRKAQTCEEEAGCSKISTQKSEIASKDKSKNLYQPLNITKSVAPHGKHPDCSNSGCLSTSEAAFLSSGNLESSSKEDSSLLLTQQKLKLDTWGLPQSILRQYAKRGITEMFPWQVECLCCPRVLNGGNLVYSAPTSAGKTLVSEIVCIKTILERRKKVLFVLPFVSVVREKMFYFQEIFRGSKVRVDGYMGGHSAAGGFRSLDLAVCTIEKANSLVNRLMEENELASLGAVIVDELHLIGDPHRGYLLELLLTKLKYMSLRNNDISVQIVGMSATLPNLSLLSNWLEADLYKTSFRPVPLEELIKIGDTLYNSSLKPVRTITPEITIKNDTENIVYLCLETITNGHSVLIFCSTKSWCESLAQTVACEFRTIGLGRDINAPDSLPYKLREQLNPARISECLEQLRNCPVGLDNLLGKVVSFGVAYHHAGLSMDERDIIEGCFKNGTLRVLVATTTLSSGVNLPARRVIVRSPTFQGRSIDILSYRQMIGRAGRMGVDSAGESIIICQKTEQRIVANLVCSTLKPIESCLGHGDLSASLKRAILEVIAGKVASTPKDLDLYTNCTLLAQSKEGTEDSSNPVSACITFLEDSELIRLQTGEDGVLRYSATPLGQACLSASIHPDEGLRLFQELQRARQCFVLENELHLVYQVTPFNVADQWNNLDWMHVLSLWEQLPPDMKRVGELVGVEDRFIVRAMRGTINLKLEKQRQKLLVHRRFYTALALHDLVNEVPLNSVATKFNCSRGMLQSLQQSAATYAGMVTSFCHRLGWSSCELIINQFQNRLHFGTHRELLDLLRLPSLNGPRARALYDAGITCVSEMTTADVLTIENALIAAIPFLSDKEKDGETTSELQRRKALKGIWITGRQGLSEREAAEFIIKEARSIIQAELGLEYVNWDQRKQENKSVKKEADSLLGTEPPAEEKPTTSCEADSAPPIQCEKNVLREPEPCIGRIENTTVADVEGNTSSTMQQDGVNTAFVEINSEMDVRKAINLSKSDAAVEPEISQVGNDSNREKVIEVDFLETMSSYKKDVERVLKETLNNPDLERVVELDGIDRINNSDLESVIQSENSAVQKVDGEENSERIIEPIDQCVLEGTFRNDETCHTDSSKNISKNLSTDIFDNNICDFSNLSETVENILPPNERTTVENISCLNNNLSTPIKSEKNLQASLDNLFETSFSNSALAKLAANITDVPISTRKESSEQPHIEDHASIHQSNSCMGSWSMSMSAIDRLCAQEENRKKSETQVQNKVDSSDLEPIPRRLSLDLFACSPSENNSPTIKESEDMFASFITPACDRVLRPRNRSGGNSESKGRQNLESPLLFSSDSKSPSLFGDSFEINTGLLEALDGRGANSSCSKIAHDGSPALGIPKVLKGLCKELEVKPLSSIVSAKQEEPHKWNGTRCGSNASKDPSFCRNSANLRLGLSCKGMSKKSQSSNKTVSNISKETGSEVLTDSFLEAAFQTAFYSESNIQHSSELAEKCDSSPTKEKKTITGRAMDEEEVIDRKRQKISDSSDDEVVNTPPENEKTLRKSFNALSGSSAALVSYKRKSNKQEVGRNKTSSIGIGPPLTRKMLANRQKSSFSIEKTESGPSHTFICENSAKRNEVKNPYTVAEAEEDWTTYNIIDICRSKILFKTFYKEVLAAPSWAVSLACEKIETGEPLEGIGSKILKTQKTSRQGSKSCSFEQLSVSGSTLVGVSFCFGGPDAYFLSLEKKSEHCIISLNDRLELLKKVLCRENKITCPTVCSFDLKEQFKMLFRCTGIQMYNLSLQDPKVADWLLEPEGKEKTLQSLVIKYCERAIGLAEHAGNVRCGQSSPALDVDQTIPGRQRSSVEAILCYQIMSLQFVKLQAAGLLSCFIDVEMPVVVCVGRMELTGIGFNTDTVQNLQDKLREEMGVLEKKAYYLAGRTFSLTSPADTGRVLYQELRLGQGQSLKGRQKNTSKETLSKLRSEHPLPEVILMWRKLNAIHSKTVCPLLPSEPCSRLFGLYILHTATGRISMLEPNIQCIPRDFEISLESKESFCMRTAFVASSGTMLVAADYSQLELRLLAHLSGDAKLQTILNEGQDVFKNLAASWNNIPFEQVADDHRQKAKQICYGIIYGMGPRALADQLQVEESEAVTLMETFHLAFPGISEFLSSTVKQCQDQGYVTTLLGRRRYLPGITSSNIHLKAHAERQAVNTTVQGSAADLAKTAMITVEKIIYETFPQALCTEGKQFSLNVPRLVLHLHDELMYEVPSDCLDQFCQILKDSMESAISISVKLPVKVKVGKTWGTLKLKTISG